MSGVSRSNSNGANAYNEKKEPEKKPSSRSQDLTRFGNPLSFPSNTHRPLTRSAAARREKAQARVSNSKVSSVASRILTPQFALPTENQVIPETVALGPQISGELPETGTNIRRETGPSEIYQLPEENLQPPQEIDWAAQQGSSMDQLIANEVAGNVNNFSVPDFEDQDSDIFRQAESILLKERNKTLLEAQRMHEQAQLEMSARHEQEKQELLKRAEREQEAREYQLTQVNETLTNQKLEDAQSKHKEDLQKMELQLVERQKSEIEKRIGELQRQQEAAARTQAHQIILEKIGKIPNKSQEWLFYPAQFDIRLPVHLTIKQLLEITTPETRQEIFKKYQEALQQEGFDLQVTVETVNDAELFLRMKRGVYSLLVEAGEWRRAYDNLLLRILPQFNKKAGSCPTEDSLKGMDRNDLQEIQDGYTKLLAQYKIPFVVTDSNFAIVDLMIQISVNRGLILNRITKILEKGGYFNIPKNYEDLIQYLREQTPKIEKLDLSNLGLYFPPREISMGVWRSEELNLDLNNILFFLPDSFCFMRELKRFFVRENPLIALPTELGHHLTNLSVINCSRICPAGLPVSIVQNCRSLSAVNVGPLSFDMISEKIRNFPKPAKGKEYPFLDEVLGIFLQDAIANLNWNNSNSDSGAIFLDAVNNVVENPMEIDEATLRNWYDSLKKIASIFRTSGSKKIEKLSQLEKEAVSSLYSCAIARYGIFFLVDVKNWLEAEKYISAAKSVFRSIKPMEDEAIRTATLRELQKSAYFKSLKQPVPSTLEALNKLLEQFPDLIKDVKCLQLGEFGLVRVPEFIHKLTCVSTLDLSNNHITRLPAGIIMSLEKLTMLNIHGNPIEILPPVLVKWLSEHSQVVCDDTVLHPETAKLFKKSNEEHRKKIISQPQPN